MSIYEQRIIVFQPRRVEAGTVAIMSAGTSALAAKAGRIFGVFKPVIGISMNHAVVITEWPDVRTADAWGHLALDSVDGAATEIRETWEPTYGPKPGESPSDVGGIYSHRTFDILEGDWPRFRELSEQARGSFEVAHAAHVAGFWKSMTRPNPGQLRIWLMVWYRDLGTWERSRFWNPNAREDSTESFSKLRERSNLLQNTSVSILARVPAAGEQANVASALT
jgi:hypothetical protein